MNELYDMVKFIGVCLFGTSIFIWINIIVFLLISKLVKGQLDVSLDIPIGRKKDEMEEQEVTLEEEPELPFSTDSEVSFKDSFAERINKLKEEQTNNDGSFSYDENTEMKMQQVLDKLNEEIGDDLPAGIEVVTNEYERDLEQRR